MSPVVEATALAFAVGAVAQIGSSSQISRPLRVWIAQRAKGSDLWKWLSDLIGCAFCEGVWLSAAGVGIVRPWLTGGPVIIQWGVAWLAVSAAAMLPVLIIRKALKA
jgi:hypothetical protein